MIGNELIKTNYFKMNILITGATGFLGSHVCKDLVNSKHKIYGICRNKSSFENCATFKEKVIWINIETENWEEKIKNIHFDILFHAAWSGVSFNERNNWDIQLTNFSFSKQIFQLSLELNIKKIICLGSQAEYGIFTHKVTEKYVPYPEDAYGSVKLLTMHYLRNLAKAQRFEWYWLRVFSVIGENENFTSLIPEVITKLSKKQSIDLTGGEQCYDYLFIDEFISRINRVINCPVDNSGVYNLCSGRPTKIKRLLILIAKKMQCPLSLLNFGAIPYRKNQNMFMVGSPNKFENAFGTFPANSIENTISELIKLYKNN